MLLASYKSIRPGLQGLANRAIRWRLTGEYSHTELVFEQGDPVSELMPDSSTAPGPDGALWCASSVAVERLPSYSPRRAGRSGGVRFKRIALDTSRWDLVRVQRDPMDVIRAAAWFEEHQGELYDWQLIAGHITWLIPGKDGRWTCTKAVAAALGVPESEAWRVDPCNGHILLPSYRRA